MTTKLTLMQKLLGKHYKWWYLLKYGIKKNTAYRISTLIWMFGSLITLLITIFIWWINIQSGSTLVDFKTIFTYYIFGNIVSLQNGVQWNLSMSIQNGEISSRLLRPSNFMAQAIVSDFGWWLFPRIVEILLLLVIGIFGFKFIIFSSFWNFILYILMGIIGYFISIFISYILGSIAFFITDTEGVMEINNQLNFILSGKALPLSIIPALFGANFLPFAFTFYHPMQIYLGKYDFNQTVLVFIGGISWCIILYFLAKWIFKIGLKRNEAVGL
jgi:ABC-2 type transport system permease protein